MITVLLYGELGKKFGHEWHLELDINSPAGAVRALAALRPGFLPFIEQLNDKVVGYHVQVDTRDVSNSELCDIDNDAGEICFTPLIHGADTKGILQIVAGVALIAVGVVIAVGTFGTGTFLGASAVMWGLQIGLLGAAIALGGVSRLMMSTPSAGSSDPTKTRSSYAFSGVVNVTGNGTCVPVTFGRVIQGSKVVSAGIQSWDQNSGGTTGTGTTGSGSTPPIAIVKGPKNDDR